MRNGKGSKRRPEDNTKFSLNYDQIRWPKAELKDSYVAVEPKGGGPVEALGPLSPSAWDDVKSKYEVLYTGTMEEVIRYVRALG